MIDDNLVSNLLSFELPTYMVLDGAIVENIDEYIASFRLSSRPFFRETIDRASVLAGPWLVIPSRDQAGTERLMMAARGAGQGVLWMGYCDEEMIYSHLRKLNAAQMPDGQVLYFRHYDVEVLASVIPLLDGEQAAQLFGPAQAIALVGGSGDGGIVERPESLPDQRSGPMRFEAWQIEALDELQRVRSRQKIARVLKREYPEKSISSSDPELYERVCMYEREGQSLGLASEESLANWARLNFATDNRASKHTGLKKQILQLSNENREEIFGVWTPNLIKDLSR